MNFDRSEADSIKFNNLLESEDSLIVKRVSINGETGVFEVPKNKLKCNSCIAGQSGCCRTCSDQIFSFIKSKKEIPDLNTIPECVAEGWPEKYNEALKEGCRIQGKVLLSRVPGELHFSSGKKLESDGVLDISLFRENRFDFSHKINRISFGESTEVAVDPLRGLMVTLSPDDNITYSYYLKLVPYQLNYKNGTKSSGFHLSATRHQRKNIGETAFPIVFFNYEFSAMSLIQTQSRRPFSSFITGFCAIIGGIYTLSALIDSFIFSVERSLKVKAGYGKLY